MTTDQPVARSGQGDLLSAFGRLWWVVLIMAVLGAGAGVAWAQLSPQQYSSRVTLVVQLPRDGSDPEARVRTVEALMLSNVVLSEIVQDSGVALSPTQVEDLLTVERPTGSAVIEVVVRGTRWTDVDSIAEEVVPALEDAIDGLAPIEEEGAGIELTSFEDNPVVVRDARQPVRFGALGGLAGAIVGILLVALISGRRARTAGA
jgi:polysaccharide biosynthesis transport protein